MTDGLMTNGVTGDTILPMTRKIVYKPTPPVRKPKMYLNRDRACCDCGSNRTNDIVVNRVLWHKDVDDQGKWTGKYLCHKCYNRVYSKKRKKEIELMRQKFIEERNSRLEKLEKEEIEDNEEKAVG